MSLEYSCFISYRRDEYNHRYTTNLKKIIQSELHRVTNKERAFLDEDSIRYAEEFDTKIYFGIENSFFFIPIWSYHYLHEDNSWCAKELYHALQIEKKIKDVLPEDDKINFYYIIPLIIRGDVKDLPTCLSRKFAVNIQNLEADIINNRTSQRLTNFKIKLYEILLDYYKTIFKNNIDYKKILSTLEKPDDNILKEWIAIQRNEIHTKELNKEPIIKKTDE